MPFSETGVALNGSGVGTICQLVPSQRSAAVEYVTVPGPPRAPVKTSAEPTARHDLADEQSTALSLVPVAPGAFGVGGTVQAADATEGASSSPTAATRERTNGRGGSCLKATVAPYSRCEALTASSSLSSPQKSRSPTATVG